MTQANNRREIRSCPQGFSCSALLPWGHQSLEEVGGMGQVWVWCKWEAQLLQQRRKREVISLKMLRTALGSASLNLRISVMGYLRGGLHNCSVLAVEPGASPAPEITGSSQHSALPWLKHPAEKQKIFAQAQHDANTTTLLLDKGQLTQDRPRDWAELMKSCLYTHRQDQLHPIYANSDLQLIWSCEFPKGQSIWSAPQSSAFWLLWFFEY